MPYSIPDINGIAYGATQDGNADLFLIPLASSPYSFSAEQAMQSAREWLLGERRIQNATAFMGWVDGRFLPDMPSGWTGIVGRGEDLSILFRWNKKLTVVDALREVEQAEGGLPAWLCASLHTASTAIDRKLNPQLASSAVYFAASICSKYPAVSPPLSFMSRSDLETLVDGNSLVDLLASSVPEIRSGTDYSRFLHLVGSRVLDDRWYLPRRTESLKISQSGIADRISFFGACHLALEPEPKVALSYVPLKIILPSGNLLDAEKNLQQSSVHGTLETGFAWYDYSIQIALPATVVRAFFPGGKVNMSKFPDSVEIINSLSLENHPAALHLANSLIEDTEQKASYAPQGLYRVLLPQGLSITQKGVSALNIYFEMDRMWVQLLLPDACPTIFPWSAKDFRKDPSEYPNSFSLMMAALNRDFRCAAEDCFPVEAVSHSPMPIRDPSDSPSAPSVRSKGKSIRMLPVSHGGHRVWGYQVEREYLARRSHMVGAFTRRLSEEKHRRENALDLAVEFGIVLPSEHHTIVLPHQRGGKPGIIPDASNPPVIRSRGLAATIAYSNLLHDLEVGKSSG
jgi:hypothetical protein